MPELPEIETIARGLERAIAGARITGLTAPKPDVLREATADVLRDRTVGATIVTCWRRAKLVVIDLSTGDRIVVQPRFTGALLVDDGDLPEHERRYSAVAFSLADGRVLHYRDIRRLGTVALMRPERWIAYAARLGIEPLDRTFTGAYLSALIKGSGQAVKKLVMDQHLLAGVGNIYANEALWRARIDPSRAGRSLDGLEAERLRGAIVEVLTEAIAARGTSFRDYRDASGERGTFARALQAYGRGGQPCHRCGARMVVTYAVDGRSTVFCAWCQE